MSRCDIRFFNLVMNLLILCKINGFCLDRTNSLREMLRNALRIKTKKNHLLSQAGDS